MTNQTLRFAVAGLLLALLLTACQAPADAPTPDVVPTQPLEAEADTVPTEVPPTPEPEPTAIEVFPAGSSNALWQPVGGQLGDISMVYVPAGCFMMGTDKGHGAGGMEPAHEVCFKEPFWIDVYEVTQRQFARLDGEAGR